MGSMLAPVRERSKNAEMSMRTLAIDGDAMSEA
jgi:hypothetical protein